MHSPSLQKFSFFITVKSKRRQAVAVYSVLLNVIIFCYLVVSKSDTNCTQNYSFTKLLIFVESYFYYFTLFFTIDMSILGAFILDLGIDTCFPSAFFYMNGWKKFPLENGNCLSSLLKKCLEGIFSN